MANRFAPSQFGAEQGKLASDARRYSARSNTLCVFRPTRKALASPTPIFANRQRRRFLRHGVVRADAVHCTAYDGAVFPSAIKGTVEIACENQSSWQATQRKFVALAKV